MPARRNNQSGMIVMIGETEYPAGRAKQQGFMEGDVAFDESGNLKMILTENEMTREIGKVKLMLAGNSQLWFSIPGGKLSIVRCANGKTCSAQAGQNHIPMNSAGLNNTGEFITTVISSKPATLTIDGKKVKMKKLGTAYIHDQTGEVSRLR